MGILDAPAVPVGTQPRRAMNTLAAKLRRGKESAVLQVLGDSTGDGSSRWPYLVAQRLGAKYPTHNVDYLYWNSTGPAYDALGAGSSARIQTGSTPSPATVVDNTTRADSASTPGSTSDANAFPWQVKAGTCGITSNRLVGVAGSSIAVVSSQYADTTGSVVIRPAVAGSNLVRWYIRFQNTSNCVFAQMTVTGSSGTNFTCYKVVNGVTTQGGFAASTTYSINTDYTLTWSAIGGAISFTIGANTVTLTLTDADMAAAAGVFTETFIGFGGGGANATGFSAVSITNIAPTLTVRSASASGQICSYSQTYFTTQVPNAPDVTIINYGHNEGFQDLRPQYLRLVDQLVATFPRTSVIATMQNPRSTIDTYQAQGFARNTYIGMLAASEGWDVIDICSLFLANPTYAADYLNVDGLHPSNATGSPLWAAEVVRKLDPDTVVPFRSANAKTNDLWVPASAFDSEEGSLTRAKTNGVWSYTMAHGSAQSVLATVMVPSSWEYLDIWILWTTATASGYTGGTNNVYLEALVGWLNARPGYQVGTLAAYVAPTSFGFGFGTLTNNSIPYTQQATKVAATVRPLGRPMLLQARRAGASANDTHTGDIQFQGVLIKRVS